jgi:hypothetical protein
MSTSILFLIYLILLVQEKRMTTFSQIGDTTQASFLSVLHYLMFLQKYRSGLEACLKQ